jgi:hypothetical protein
MCIAQFVIAFQLVAAGDHSNEEQTMKKLVLAAALFAAISSSPALAQSATRAVAATNPSSPLNTQTLRQRTARPFASARQAPSSGAQWWQDRGNTEEDIGEIYHR